MDCTGVKNVGRVAYVIDRILTIGGRRVPTMVRWKDRLLFLRFMVLAKVLTPTPLRLDILVLSLTKRLSVCSAISVTCDLSLIV
jgi:hypothetical protein